MIVSGSGFSDRDHQSIFSGLASKSLMVPGAWLSDRHSQSIFSMSINPSIFEYDYQAMKDRMYNSGLFEGLMMNRFHPRNILKFEDWGHEGIF